MPNVFSNRINVLSLVTRHLSLIVTCHLSLISCSGRNPNLSENQLLTLTNDSVQIVAETPPAALPDTSYVPPVGVKFTENRSVDPASPPVILKVSLQTGAKQPLKLSQFGSSVEYITLKLPDEKDFFLSETSIQINSDNRVRSHGSSTQVNKVGDYFVTSDELGIRLFDSKGAFVHNLLLSEFDGERDFKKIEIEFFESKRARLWDIFNGTCYLAMTYAKERKIWAGQYNCLSPPIHPEGKQIYGESGSLTGSPVEMQLTQQLPMGKFLDNQTRFIFTTGCPVVGTSFNAMGDTLCRFTNLVRRDESQRISAIANSDKSFFYRADGKLYFRQAYCDTIFRVQSANRIVPAYCFNLGVQRVGLEDGIRSRTQGKLIPWKWIVFKNSMVLIFTEGRDCPNCRKAGEVTFHCLLFDKQTGHATVIDMKSQYPEEALIENDIDGGLPLPLNAVNTQGDGVIASFTKGQIEEILKNNVKNIPAETASKLKAQADVLRPNEMLVMVVR